MQNARNDLSGLPDIQFIVEALMCADDRYHQAERHSAHTAHSSGDVGTSVTTASDAFTPNQPAACTKTVFRRLEW